MESIRQGQQNLLKVMKNLHHENDLNDWTFADLEVTWRGFQDVKCQY